MGVRERAIGKCRLWALGDGFLWDDAGSIFGRVPRTTWARLVDASPDNRIRLPVRAFLISSGSELILVDTGCGTKSGLEVGLDRPDGDLLAAMHRGGFGPGDVTVVINTHLHSDHAGGNTSEADGHQSPTFPRARYLIQRQEWETALDPHPLHGDLYRRDDYLPLAATGRVELLDGQSSVTAEVTCLPAPGHTPGHQIVRVVSGSARAVLVGDLATVRWQLLNPLWVCPYDLAPAESVAGKLALREWLGGAPAYVGYAHDESERIDGQDSEACEVTA